MQALGSRVTAAGGGIAAPGPLIPTRPAPRKAKVRLIRICGSQLRAQHGRSPRRQTRIGIRTYNAEASPASCTIVGAEPSAKRNSTASAIWSVMSFR